MTQVAEFKGPIVECEKDQRNAPWSRGECAACGQEVLLARAYPTYGSKLCETCEGHEQAEKDWQKRVAEVVAELREMSESEWLSDEPAQVVLTQAADLVAEKLGVKS